MYFHDIIGQQNVKDRLLQSVKEGCIPHAQLFSGAEGTGALPLAIAYARYISCTNRGEADACGACPSCHKFNKLIHPDTHFVFPIFKPSSGKKWVCDDFLIQWRNFVSEKTYFGYQEWMTYIKAGNSQGVIYGDEGDEILRKLSFKAFESEYKVMIIWLPEKMGDVCANRLLKILEEPPAKTVFLLVSENSGQLLSTILSRAQMVKIKGIEANDMQEALKDQFTMSDTELDSCIHLSGGSWLKALDYIQSSDENKFYLQQFIRCMRGAYTIANFSPDKKLDKQKSLKDLKLWSEEMAKLGREQGKHYLTYSQRLVRENFIMNVGQPEINYLTPDEMAFSGKFSPFINHKNILSFMEELELAERHIEQNVNAKIVFFDLALKSIMLFKK
ncbi:MAG: DNA polymerase III subunit delta [Bacteroidales bacterium]|nr:DNA polymerase III subunit delta [Bacteroidales bacterium]